MKQFLRSIRAQRGFTIVEVLVVVAIVGILAAVSFNLVTSIFVTSLRSSQIAVQEANMERTYGFLGSRLAVTQPSPGQLGLLNSNNNVVLPKNELFFRSSYTGLGAGQVYCYRINYDLASRKLELAQTTSDTACGELQKSQYTFAEAKNLPSVSSSLLAEGVIPVKNDSGVETSDNVCQVNNVSSGGLFSYNGSGSEVTEVTAAMAFCPTPEPDSIVKVAPRRFEQTFSIGQLCLTGSGSSGSVGQNSIGPEEIENFPSDAAILTTGDISASSVDSDGNLQWYEVSTPASWKNGLWKLYPGFYNISASAQFSWNAAGNSASGEAAAIAIVRNTPGAPAGTDPKIAYSSGPAFAGRAYVSTSIGVRLAAGDDISLWVATTSTTPDRFEGARISGTWANN